MDGSVEEVLALDPRQDVFLNAQELDRLTEDYRRTKSLNGIEVQWKCKDGRVIIVRLSGRAVSSDDETEEVLEIIAEDITERRQLEEQWASRIQPIWREIQAASNGAR